MLCEYLTHPPAYTILFLEIYLLLSNFHVSSNRSLRPAFYLNNHGVKVFFSTIIALIFLFLPIYLFLLMLLRLCLPNYRSEWQKAVWTELYSCLSYFYPSHACSLFFPVASQLSKIVVMWPGLFISFIKHFKPCSVTICFWVKQRTLI